MQLDQPVMFTRQRYLPTWFTFSTLAHSLAQVFMGEVTFLPIGLVGAWMGRDGDGPAGRK